MGATNNIKETNLSLKLNDKSCDRCSHPFTQLEIDQRNFDFWWDNTHDVELKPLSQGYQFSIWIRSIEHQNCPEIKQENHV